METGLYCNRFRRYSPAEGLYTQPDPIGLAGGNPTLYAYVGNPLWEVDPFGLTGTYIFTDGTTWYIGKGPVQRMRASMNYRIGGIGKATMWHHVDYGSDAMGLMVEAELMRRKGAVRANEFANAINSPGRKLLESAYSHDPNLYSEALDNAIKFEKDLNFRKEASPPCTG